MLRPSLRSLPLAIGTLLALTAPALAGVCTRPGYPVGCTPGHATPVLGPGGPVVNPTPGVGYGAPGAGVRPAAGPGIGPNTGGPVNRPGRR
jgi:hypothetical protein